MKNIMVFIFAIFYVALIAFLIFIIVMAVKAQIKLIKGRKQAKKRKEQSITDIDVEKELTNIIHNGDKLITPHVITTSNIRTGFEECIDEEYLNQELQNGKTIRGMISEGIEELYEDEYEENLEKMFEIPKSKYDASDLLHSTNPMLDEVLKDSKTIGRHIKDDFRCTMRNLDNTPYKVRELKEIEVEFLCCLYSTLNDYGLLASIRYNLHSDYWINFLYKGSPFGKIKVYGRKIKMQILNSQDIYHPRYKEFNNIIEAEEYIHEWVVYIMYLKDEKEKLNKKRA